MDTSINTNAINKARTSSIIDIFWRKLRKGVVQTLICLSITLMKTFHKHLICTKLLYIVKEYCHKLDGLHYYSNQGKF